MAISTNASFSGKSLSNDLRAVCFVCECVIKLSDALIKRIQFEIPFAYQIFKTQGQLSWHNAFEEIVQDVRGIPCDHIKKCLRFSVNGHALFTP